MRKKALLYLMVIFNVLIHAQPTDDQKYLLTNNTKSLGVTTHSIIDPYLSPLTYRGLGVLYNFETLRYLSTESINISIQNKLSYLGGMTFNPALSATMLYMGTIYSWGMHYHFRPRKGLMLMAGGNTELDFAVKSIARNINNPANVDLATNFNLSGRACYDIQTRKRTMQLQMALQSPLLGCMFVPRWGASYYEMFRLWNLTNAFHISSLHNKRGLNANLMLQIPFNFSTLRVGFGYNGLKYSANEMVFKRNAISLLIGTTFDVATFGGTKNHPPKNFMSTNE